MSTPATDYLPPESTTDVARMVMALMSEVWIARDRQIVTEYLLETKGSVTRAELDDFVPTGELAEAIAAERQRFANLVAGAPLAARQRSVAQILERAGMARPGTSTSGS
ncbi:hypothetical protein HT136_16850 [Novosphingobium profundi]|uniref:hypothetical protein n=1 Tax=Novosphingobium profundi TaxID=1774954 RepID=UPI001BDB62D0|nr:hypothetical protein [Novosphingobium profundi]MBT0670036.1 hypothetical protein [Novosphingobium profundi]